MYLRTYTLIKGEKYKSGVDVPCGEAKPYGIGSAPVERHIARCSVVAFSVSCELSTQIGKSFLATCRRLYMPKLPVSPVKSRVNENKPDFLPYVSVKRKQMRTALRLSLEKKRKIRERKQGLKEIFKISHFHQMI